MARGQGFAAIRVVAAKGELNYCYVLPEYRGRGVATRLLESRIEYLGKPGQTIDQAIDEWVAKQNGSLPDPWEALTGDYQLKRSW